MCSDESCPFLLSLFTRQGSSLVMMGGTVTLTKQRILQKRPSTDTETVSQVERRQRARDPSKEEGQGGHRGKKVGIDTDRFFLRLVVLSLTKVDKCRDERRGTTVKSETVRRLLRTTRPVELSPFPYSLSCQPHTFPG